MTALWFVLGALFALGVFIGGTLFERWLHDREAKALERRLTGDDW